MPSHSDHVRRDAEHTARSLIRVRAAQYLRRMDEQAKADIQQAIEEATLNGEAVDGSRIGAMAANRALETYGIAAVTTVLDGTAAPVLGPGE